MELPRRAARVRQDGMTLIEVIIGLFVLGTVVTAGVTGLFFSIRQNAQLSAQAVTDVSAADFSEGIKLIPYRLGRLQNNPVQCPATAVVNIESAYTQDFRDWVDTAGTATVPAKGWLQSTTGNPTPLASLVDANFSVTKVMYWNAVTKSWDGTPRCVPFDAYLTNANSNNPAYADQGIQKLTLQVDWGPAATRQIKKFDIVKRKS